MRLKLITLLTVLLSIILCIMMTHCASPGSIQGGPKDESPPMVDSLKSSPTPQINFTTQDIVITFNEWVKLDDPFNQIFISPPLEKRPQYRLKGKSLIISFDESEVLQENTTYILNLGTSVQDITESNPVLDYQFVFSTGNQLDSLGFTGIITDAITGKPVENVSVMLYDNLRDTAITTLPPAYFVRTNKEGKYRFNYLRADTFQLLAYVDENVDFRYNGEIEPLGFIPIPISTREVNDSTLSFSLSLGPPPVYLDKVDSTQNGLITLTFTGPVTDSALLKVDGNHILHFDRINSQLRLYYDSDSLPVQVITTNSKKQRDTVVVMETRDEFLKSEDLVFDRTDPTLIPGEFLKLMTNWPVLSLNTSQIQLLNQNTGKVMTLDSAYHNFNTIYIKYPWLADSTYQMTLLPGAVLFKSDIVHDTVDFRIQPVSPESLASLVITLTANDDYQLPPQFVLRLKQKDNVIAEKITKKLDQKTTFTSLKPGSYTLEVIWDENQNGIWDPARYPGRLPAEQIQKVEIENLRVNWIQETEVQLE